MKRIAFLLSLLVSSAVTAQSIIVSPGGFGVSGVGGAQAEVVPALKQPEADDAFLRHENEFLRSALEAATKQKAVVRPVDTRVAIKSRSKRREWYLVSESWCQNCPAAKRRFRDKGWPEANIITIAECKRRFNFSVPYVPFEFGEPVSQTVVSQTEIKSVQPVQIRQSVNAVNYGGVMYSAPVCNNPRCAMCNAIRAGLRQYRPMSIELLAPEESSDEEDPEQAPTPDSTALEALTAMELTASDIFCDLGCGDGRILISAVRDHGVRWAIGVEIDPVKAEEARQRVRDAGLSDRISVITGDALDFQPSQHGVTALYMYLYPELLAKMDGKFSGIRVGASPFHPVDGVKMTQSGDVWIYRQ